MLHAEPGPVAGAGRYGGNVSRVRALCASLLAALLVLTWPATAPAVEPATISGTVTGLGAGPLAGVTVTAYRYLPAIDRWSSDVTETTTDGNGDYALTGLADGTYRVSFSRDPEFRFLGEHADDQPDPDWARRFEVVAGDVWDVDAELEPPGKISGLVTDEEGTPVAADIEFFMQDPQGRWEVVSWGSAFPGTGRFTTVGMDAGAYKILVTPGDRHFPEYYDDSQTLDEAAVVELLPGGSVTDIAVRLEAAGRIAGRVTDESGVPLAGAQVQVHRAGVAWPHGRLAHTYTGDDGLYELGLLTTGDYLVFVQGPSHAHASEWWDDEPLVEDATPIHVETGQVAGGVDVSLSTGGTIFGYVSGDGTAELAGIVDVVVWRETDGVWSVAGATSTDGAGRYAVPGLATGSYRVAFMPQDSRWLPEYWRDADSLATSEEVAVSAPFETYSIDAGLELAAPVEPTETPTETPTESPTPTSTPTATTSPSPTSTVPVEVETLPAPLLALDNLARPRIRGSAVVGERLRVTAGRWSAPDVRMRYRWLANGVPIRDAVRPSFRPAPAQAGKRIRVRVVAKVPGGTRVVVRTRATQPVEAFPRSHMSPAARNMRS